MEDEAQRPGMDQREKDKGGVRRQKDTKSVARKSEG